MSKELDELYDRYRMVDESVYRRDRRLVFVGLMGLLGWALVTIYQGVTAVPEKGDLLKPTETRIYKQ